MNTYAKYCANVFVAKCTEQHEKGETIILTTQHGKEHECTVHNYLLTGRDGFHYYSITRNDGFNVQEYRKQRAERIKGWAANAEKRSEAYYHASNEGKEFLSLGEPIKVGHHSEKRHRALIERNWQRMGKCVEEGKKAEHLQSKAEYWESRANEINLSMPESIDFYSHKLEEAKARQQGLKDGSIPRDHGYSLPYATKAVKELEDKLKTAIKLWGE